MTATVFFTSAHSASGSLIVDGEVEPRTTAFGLHHGEGRPARRLEVGVVRTIGGPERFDLKSEDGRVPLDNSAEVCHVGPYMVEASVDTWIMHEAGHRA
jgi:hypothetical protein